jgi:exodeoxyribonuclease-3
VRIYSWNVNGIRAAARGGLLDWMAAAQPEVLCLQETKSTRADLSPTLARPQGYLTYWAEAHRKGYSGVATFSRRPAKSCRAGLGLPNFDNEGRVMVTTFEDIELYNVYFPNGRMSPERLAHKLAFYGAFLEQIDARAAAGHSIIFCGDVNTAHHPIDLAHPKANSKYSGFLPEERACMDSWEEHGWRDSFRYLHPDEPDAYSWWTMRTNARERNLGWRLDYFFVHQSLLPRITAAGIAADVNGADHCPVWLDLS